MKLKTIIFAELGAEREVIPKTLTVDMTIEEALWVAKIAGKQRGSSPHNEIYSCLVGDVFNRYWDDGVDDADKEFHVEIPPIIYSC